jgi:peptidoglycan L-alanyl-D-glutamate endopeptidase CwlK
MTFDSRTESNLATLHPEAQKRARAFMSAACSMAAQRDLQVRIICGTRTWAEQDALYAKGRTTPGPIVTKARGGQSNHNFSIAFDVGVFSFDGKKYLGDHAFYRELGPLGESLGFEWGGRWKFRDEPHYQLRPAWAAGLPEREMLASLRDRVSKKIDLFA